MSDWVERLSLRFGNKGSQQADIILISQEKTCFLMQPNFHEHNTFFFNTITILFVYHIVKNTYLTKIP